MRYFTICSFIFLFCLQARSQQVTVRGGFFADSIGIGEKTKYYLTAKYPEKLNVLFPDSTFDLQPFEYDSKQYFPTETKDSISYDSVIYLLSTFEVDRIQQLGLPVFIISVKDTLFYHATADSVLISQMVAHVPDTIPIDRLPLKINTAYQNVPFLFNYPVVSIVLGVIIILALIFFLVFGSRISKHYRLKRLRKNYEKFVAEYSAKLDKIKTTTSAELTESTLTTWKKYLEQLEGRPYTKLTTRETVLIERDEALGSNLQKIDKSIYGHEDAVLQPLISLRDYAEKKFTMKLDEVKHGK